jgi:hypothetical protein
MTTPLRRTVILAAILVSIPTAAHAEHRCAGWAVPGAVGGAFAGGLGTVGAFKLAGADLNDPTQQTRNLWIVGSVLLLGATTGPLASCALFDDEPHAIPIATFVLAGAALGATGLGAGWAALDGRHHGGTPDGQATGEGAAGLEAIVIVVGALGGGVGGYFLHRAVFPERVPELVIAPIASRDVRGLALAGAF